MTTQTPTALLTHWLDAAFGKFRTQAAVDRYCKRRAAVVTQPPPGFGLSKESALHFGRLSVDRKYLRKLSSGAARALIEELGRLLDWPHLDGADSLQAQEVLALMKFRFPRAKQILARQQSKRFIEHSACGRATL